MTTWQLHLLIKIMWFDCNQLNGRAWFQLRWKPWLWRVVLENNLHVDLCEAAEHHEKSKGETKKAPALFCLSDIRQTVKKRGSSSCLCICNISLSSSWDWRMGGSRGRQRKGCKLIRFLSLHAPLPVLFLSNPCGQRCAAQRLDSQTQWGNNWYKQHLAAETLSVIQSDTVSPLPPVFSSKCFQSDSKALYSLFRFFLHPFILSELLQDFYILPFTN